MDDGRRQWCHAGPQPSSPHPPPSPRKPRPTAWAPAFAGMTIRPSRVSPQSWTGIHGPVSQWHAAATAPAASGLPASPQYPDLRRTPRISGAGLRGRVRVVPGLRKALPGRSQCAIPMLAHLGDGRNRARGRSTSPSHEPDTAALRAAAIARLLLKAARAALFSRKSASAKPRGLSHRLEEIRQLGRRRRLVGLVQRGQLRGQPLHRRLVDRRSEKL